MKWVSIYKKGLWWTERRKRMALFVLVGCGLVFLVTLTLFARQYRELNRGGYLQYRNVTVRPGHPPVEALDDWMTFEYINRSFGLPDSYLREKLQIVDTHYPKMSVRRAIQESAVPTKVYMDRLRLLVVEYAAPPLSD